MAATASRALSATGGSKWRSRDIVVTAIIGVVFGVVFQLWNALWGVTGGLFTLFPAVQNLFYGVWLVPAVLAPLIVRKPGAALFAELVAAGLSAVIGSQFGPDALLSGLLQGGAAELVFLAFRYRAWSLPVLALAAAASATAAWVHDWIVYSAAMGFDVQVWYWVFAVVSAVVIAAAGSVLLVRSLRPTGVLKGFPAG